MAKCSANVMEQFPFHFCVADLRSCVQRVSDTELAISYQESRADFSNVDEKSHSARKDGSRVLLPSGSCVDQCKPIYTLTSET